MTAYSKRKRMWRFPATIMLAFALVILALPNRVCADAAEPFIGEITCGGWNFCPNGWAECNGQLLPIAQNSALFALVGTTYGGDGRTNFALPNIAGRTMLHQGVGAGLSNRVMGQTGGTEIVTLTAAQLPAHNHSLNVQSTGANAASPSSRVVANVPATMTSYATTADGTTLAASAVGSSGGSQPHNNLQPYLAVKCCISLVGFWPSRP